LTCFTAAVLLTALAIPVRLSAQAPTFTVLHAFTGLSDGAFPSASLVRDNAGDLYGTTEGGGAYGHGVVFKLAAPGATTIYPTVVLTWRPTGFFRRRP
jgi:uncharacterized repeat protein (TIGR03803 family)